MLRLTFRVFPTLWELYRADVEMEVFIVGIGARVSLRTARKLVDDGDQATGLVRRLARCEMLVRLGIPTILGDLVVMSIPELAVALPGCNAIVFAAGAGSLDRPATRTLIDGDGPGKLAAAATIVNVRRFVLVSVLPEAWRER